MSARTPISKAEKKELATIKRQIDDVQGKLVARETKFLQTLRDYVIETERVVAKHDRKVHNLLGRVKSVFPSHSEYMGWCQDSIGEGILTDTVSRDVRNVLKNN